MQVRIELAGVLLQSRRYAEAAREFRAILTRSANNFPARLGLARALSWSNQHREAEHQLRILRAQRPRDPEIRAMLRSERDALEPGSREAAQWLAETPSYAPYRRALARALVREGKPRQAVSHYQRLLSLDVTRSMVREAVHAYVSAGQHDRAVVLLKRLLERVPADTAVRHGLASTFAAVRRYDAALAHYDTLIARQPSAVLLLERASVQRARRDPHAAEADVLASLKAAPSAEGYLLLGDLRRKRGNYAEAARAYSYAKVLRPSHPAVAAASAQLLRDERPIPAFMPGYNQATAWQIGSTTTRDNVGFSYTTVAARGQSHLALGIAGSVDLELRHLRESSAELRALVTGYALTAGLGREFVYGPFVTRLYGRAGFVEHGDASMFTGLFNAALFHGPWGASLEVASRPAYPSLLSAAAIVDPDIRDAPLTELSINAAFGGPLGSADFAANVQRATLSDDNERSTMQLVLRYPFTRNLTVLVTGSGMGFTERSPLYWDPKSYVTAAGGLEVAVRRSHGFSIAARVLGGPARSVEGREEIVEARPRRGDRRTQIVEVADEIHRSWQVGGGFDVNYHTQARDIGLLINYGTGRADAYRRLEASIYATRLR